MSPNTYLSSYTLKIRCN